MSTKLAQLKLGLETTDEVKNAIHQCAKGVHTSNTDVGRVYRRVRDLIEKQSIPNLSGTFQISNCDDDDADPVESPAVRGLLNLYKDFHPSGVVYVMYDKAGMGKTTAGKALLRNFYKFSGRE